VAIVFGSLRKTNRAGEQTERQKSGKGSHACDSITGKALVLACLARSTKKLPVEFRADLPNSRIARLGYDSEVLVVDVPRRVFELRVIEYVEKFQAELESVIFMNYGSLNMPKSVLLNPGPWKNRLLAVPNVPKVVLGANAPGRK